MWAKARGGSSPLIRIVRLSRAFRASVLEAASDSCSTAQKMTPFVCCQNALRFVLANSSPTSLTPSRGQSGLEGRKEWSCVTDSRKQSVPRAVNDHIYNALWGVVAPRRERSFVSARARPALS